MYLLRICAKISLWLSLTTTLIILVTTAYSRAVPTSMEDPASSFDACDGTPCVMGITPGLTRWSAAQTQFTDAGIISAKALNLGDAIGVDIDMYQSADGESVGPISMNFDDPMPIGWILLRYGTPCGVSLYPQMNLITLRYPFMLANVPLNTNHIAPELGVSSMQFKDPAGQLFAQPDICVDNITDGAQNREWLGFAPVWHYLKFIPDTRSF
jgi:hypothetical protein